MAAKKKSEEKTSKKSKSTKKSKSVKKIKLTFAPVMGAGKEFTALLRKKTMKSVYGREEPVYSPAIDGLPMELTVRKGEVIEVTQEQLDELRNRGHVETEWFKKSHSRNPYVVIDENNLDKVLKGLPYEPYKKPVQNIMFRF